MDRWMPQLSAGELRVLMCLCRFTFGFHRKKIEMGLRRLADLTGLQLSTVSEAAGLLERRGLIRYTIGFRGRRIYEITADCSKKPNSGPEPDCSEKPNTQDLVPAVNCSEEPNSHRPENQNSTVLKNRTGERNHHQNQRNKKEKRSSPEQFGGTHQETVLSSLRTDDETPKPPRERLTDPREEFIARLVERHAVGIDVQRTADLVSTELGDRNLSLSNEFLDFESGLTTNPAALHNPVGHYRRLPKKFADAAAKAVIEQQMALRAPLQVKPESGVRCPRCAGIGRLADGQTYCDCLMGVDLRRAEERLQSAARKAAATAEQDANRKESVQIR